jgi:hypothetical protein
MDKKSSTKQTVAKHIIDFLLCEGLTLMTGAALGAIISLALTWEDATNFWSMIGALLAGLGTIGLLTFGWIKGNEWLIDLKHQKRLELSIDSGNRLLSFCHDLIEYTTTEFKYQLFNLMDDYEKFGHYTVKEKKEYEDQEVQKILKKLEFEKLKLLNILIYKLSKIDLELETFSILIDNDEVESECYSLYAASISINQKIKDSVKVLFCSQNAVEASKLLEDDIGDFCNKLKDLHRITFKNVLLKN